MTIAGDVRNHRQAAGRKVHREALAIIQAGQEQLARRPRADMPGFVPSDPDQRREAKYAFRREIELDNREAIRRGDKVFDEGV